MIDNQLKKMESHHLCGLSSTLLLLDVQTLALTILDLTSVSCLY